MSLSLFPRQITLHRGRARDVLAAYPENHFAACVTDPPYGLAKEPDAAEVLRHWIAGDDYAADGAGFCGHSWDSFVPGPATWREVLRVLRPGAHLLAFAGTRTHGLMEIAIRLAGFEIRDSIAGTNWAFGSLNWIYSQGFPKGSDVSKLIDKQRHDRAEVLRVTAWIRAERDRAGLKNRDIDAAFGFVGMAGHWTSGKSQPAVPTLDQIPQLLEVLGVPLDDVPGEIRDLIWTLNGNKGQPGEAWFRREVVGTQTYGARNAEGTGIGMLTALKSEFEVTASATDEAAAAEGYKSQIKPAHEPIIVARKPMIGGLAENTKTWGTGAFNVAGCALNVQDPDYAKNCSGDRGHADRENTEGVVDIRAGGGHAASGRYPPNVYLTHHPGCRKVGARSVEGGAGTKCSYWPETCRGHGDADRSQGETFHGDPPPGWTPKDGTEEIDVWQCHADCSVGRLDEENGVLKSGAHSTDHVRHVARMGAAGIYGETDEGDTCFLRNKAAEEGGASRFFPQFAFTDADLLPFYYCAKASTGEREAGCDRIPPRNQRHNYHPTVKPVELMRWAIRLVKPVPGKEGPILDPFAGSGTTLVAAQAEGVDAVGVDLDEEEDENGKIRPAGYLEIQAARCRYAGANVEVAEIKAAGAAVPLAVAGGGLTLPSTEDDEPGENMQNQDQDLKPRPYVTEIAWGGKTSAGKIAGLGRCTLFVGDNGAGKSSWIDAIMAAETGTVENLAGKARQDGDLFALAPEGADDLQAVVRHSDGSEAVWRTERRTHTKRTGEVETTIAKPSRRGPYDPTLVFPLRDLMTAVAGGVPAQRAFFLRAAGRTITMDRIRAELRGAVPADQIPTDGSAPAVLVRFDELVGRGKPGETPADALIRATKQAEAEARAAGERRDQATRRINEKAAALGVRPTDEEIEAAKARFTEIEAQIQGYHEAIAAAGWSPYVDAATVRTTADGWKAEIARLKADLDENPALPEVPDEDPKQIRRAALGDALALLAHAHRDKGLGRCLLCGGEPGAAAIAERAETHLSAVDADRAAKEARDAARRAYAERGKQRDEWTRTWEALEDKLTKTRAVGSIIGRDRAAAETAKAAADKALQDLRARRTLHHAIAEDRRTVVDDEAAAVEWAALAGILRGVTATLLDSMAPAFVERVNRFLPARWRFGLVLWDDGREVCRWGLLACQTCHGRGKVRSVGNPGVCAAGAPEVCDTCGGSGAGDALHAYTSGAEWATLLAAVGGACVPADYRGLSILVLPDAFYRADRLREALAALAAFPGQVLATAPVFPEPPETAKRKAAAWRVPGWTYVIADDAGGWTVDAPPAEKPAKAEKPEGTGRRPGRPRKGKNDPQVPLLPPPDLGELADDAGEGGEGADGEAPRAGAADPDADLPTLEALGFDDRQRAKLARDPDAAHEIRASGYTPGDVSVLADGSFVKIPREVSDPGYNPGGFDDLLD